MHHMRLSSSWGLLRSVVVLWALCVLLDTHGGASALDGGGDALQQPPVNDPFDVETRANLSHNVLPLDEMRKHNFTTGSDASTTTHSNNSTINDPSPTSKSLSTGMVVLLIISLLALVTASVMVLCSLLSKSRSRHDHHLHPNNPHVVDLVASRYREDVFCSDEFQQLWACSACSFENFDFQRNCSLCGTSMDSMFSPVRDSSAPFVLGSPSMCSSSCEAPGPLESTTANLAVCSTTSTTTTTASTALAVVIKNRSRNCSSASTVTSMASLSESFLSGNHAATSHPSDHSQEGEEEEEESKTDDLCSSSSDLLGKLEREQQKWTQSQRFQQAMRRKRWIRTFGPDGSLIWRSNSQCGVSSSSPHVAESAKPQTPTTSLPTSPATLAIVKPFVSRLEKTKSPHASGRLILEPALNSFASCCCRFGAHQHDKSSTNATECPHMRFVSLHDAALLHMSDWSFPQKQLWFMGECTALMNRHEHSSEHMLLIPRHDILQSTMVQLTRVSHIELHRPLRVQFQGEPGIDAGGLVREWFSLVTKEFLDEANGLFVRVAATGSGSCLYTVNPTASKRYPDNHLKYFCAFGRCIGKALLEGQLVGIPFASPLFKHLLGMPIDFTDLEMMDPLLAQSLQSLQSLSSHELQQLDLDFSICESDSLPSPIQPQKSAVRIVDLKPNGRHIAVTVANRQEYLDLLFRWIMAEKMTSEAAALMQGVYDVVPFALLSIFDHQELELLLCGAPQVDVEDWERNTIVCGGARGRRMAKWFWKILRGFSNDQRCKLLQFTTGSARVPVHGFRALATSDGRICPFTFNVVSKKECSFLRAFTCFNRIDVPAFSSEKEFEHALRLLVQLEVTGFSMN